MADKPIGISRFSLLDPSGTRVTVVAHLAVEHQPPRQGPCAAGRGTGFTR